MPVTVLKRKPLKDVYRGGCILALHNRGASITMGLHVTRYQTLLWYCVT